MLCNNDGRYIRSFDTRSFQLVEAIEFRVRGQPAGLELDMISWMGRTALELIGQAGLGYSFDPLVADTPDDFGYAIKTFQYVLSLSQAHRRCVRDLNAITVPR